jgi:Ion channel
MPVPGKFGIIRKLRRSLLYLVAVFVVSVLGYLSFGWSLIDSVYMVVITMFSVGFEEVHPLTTVWQKIFTMALSCEMTFSKNHSPKVTRLLS